MPAGRKNVCEACYWRGLHKKRVKLDQAVFESPRFATLFADFGAWLQCHVGEHRAALTVHRYVPFFAEIEKHWGTIPAYPDLLKSFGAEGLRRVRLPMKWLAESKQTTVDAVAREADSEIRRVGAIIATVPAATVGAIVLSVYSNKLRTKIAAGKLTTRSMRLALRPAASLLLSADASGRSLPDQTAVDGLLCKAPGQLAALSGFIRFLNERYTLGLTAAVDEKFVAARRRKSLERTLLTLARSGDGKESFLREWVCICLEYFHGLPLRLSRQISDYSIAIDADGCRVSIAGREYWIPTRQSVAG
ncbi:hypothetical protein ACFPTO_11820 [Paraburkholderia denitrificans]|uniref:Uncharacterized protein n=1 Tax=Paraburkholderia denitrificans TaxID=694025 RepID=A0ABW0J8S0_9BURK